MVLLSLHTFNQWTYNYSLVGLIDLLPVYEQTHIHRANGKLCGAASQAVTNLLYQPNCVIIHYTHHNLAKRSLTKVHFVECQITHNAETDIAFSQIELLISWQNTGFKIIRFSKFPFLSNSFVDFDLSHFLIEFRFWQIPLFTCLDFD